jgi:hypothetical protein
MSDATKPLWLLDADRVWWLAIGGVRVWIAARPFYCDRGHWVGNVDGVGSIDLADAFPRYYMDLDRAKAEMADWLRWRLQREGNPEGNKG